MRPRKRDVALIVYFVFLLLPLYWLINMSLKPNAEILGGLTLFPQTLTFQNYVTIFSDPDWYGGYINSIIYVTMTTVISLPMDYRFSTSPARTAFSSTISAGRFT